ncbi:MAG TPA: hypothetical protein VF250_15700, partial [Conexibacter sp.]
CSAAFVVPAGAAPSARLARARPRLRSCDISGVADRLGPTEVTSLKVAGLRCGRGIRVVRAFHVCRLKNGPSGRCVRLVQGYACMEQRLTGPTEFTAAVTCRKRSATVTHRYRQVL